MDIKVLNDTIKKRKEELNQLVIKYGVTHPKVINVSQDIDRLVYQLMSRYRPQNGKKR
ncbi:Spo0E family sporulation regulatory protein-aspartic acid phosphatase [Bacillus cereus]|uniref:Spo0E family sporulation regulatory protein-aspartic acid phosphatase n=1 Tax=Bacillus cereus TaxID=1396 RepID=A0A2C1EL75_BACCE|nr:MULTISPECIES: aspartyl-phosphate phosphatase Spo0E family protein [Bacillus cereus group]MEA1012679.1 aspartyl-phosphate phosphatase Spo0E family protein [Bacillus cereus]PES90519.1 Spo0E family sporulation regulatory protein-aspartic acid phosphatase [Bacillus cereus]PGT13513.1 Spo0E family sporulation regulatory protein-aspartic acid phosphatase [Bacillus cereus]